MAGTGLLRSAGRAAPKSELVPCSGSCHRMMVLRRSVSRPIRSMSFPAAEMTSSRVCSRGRRPHRNHEEIASDIGGMSSVIAAAILLPELATIVAAKSDPPCSTLARITAVTRVIQRYQCDAEIGEATLQPASESQLVLAAKFIPDLDNAVFIHAWKGYRPGDIVLGRQV